MPPKTAATPQPHMGRKIEGIRTIKGIKQDTLAKQLGVSKSTVSRIESSETIDDDMLQKIANALEMTVEAIENFSEERVINNIQNNYDNATGGPQLSGPSCTNTFNPLEKYAEAMEENKKLYERMLEMEREKIKYLEELLKKK